jgi:hypothetical protein
MKLLRPIDTREKYNEMMSFANINSIGRHNRHLIHNFYVTHISNRPLCMSCNDAIWAALQSIKQLINEDGESILSAIAAQEVAAYQDTKTEANPFSDEELAKAVTSRKKKKKDDGA